MRSTAASLIAASLALAACGGTNASTSSLHEQDGAEEPNACGGSALLSFDGGAAAPGDPCGPCRDGALVCASPNLLACVGARPANVCADGAAPDATAPDATFADGTTEHDASTEADASMGEASSTGPFTLRVNLAAIAGAPTGTVTVAAPGAVSCGPNCYTIPIGTVATLTETPDPSGSGPFTQWGGDCAAAGSAAQCTVTMTTDRTATAYFRSTYNLMFYTTTVYEPAALGVPSLATADGYCAARAAAGHLGGTKWLAWLSTSSVNAASRLSSTGGWLRTDGKLFATDLTSLITAPYLTSAGTVYYPPRVDEFGSEAASPTTPTTGTHVDGTASAGQTCNDFTDPTQPSPLLGETTRSSVGWTENQTDPAGSCGPSLEFPIYCFEADFSATPPKPQLPASSRIAFVTRGYFDASSGVSGADGLCASEASSAHLSGTFIALLATSTASATSRLSLTGPNWYRPDGVQITNTPADLANGTIHASINVTADGAGYFGDVFTFTGGQTVPGSPSAISATCQDWTSNSSTLMAPFGSANESYVWFWTGGGASCALGAPVFCVQQ